MTQWAARIATSDKPSHKFNLILLFAIFLFFFSNMITYLFAFYFNDFNQKKVSKHSFEKTNQSNFNWIPFSRAKCLKVRCIMDMIFYFLFASFFIFCEITDCNIILFHRALLPTLSAAWPLSAAHRAKTSCLQVVRNPPQKLDSQASLRSSRKWPDLRHQQHQEQGGG